MNDCYRHAYMIIAYNQWDLLEILISLLDDERNDIYIHINKLIENVPFDHIKGLSKKSKITFVDRVAICRGTYSVFDAEMVLLKKAIKGGYRYYHLLSGQDLPLKDQDYIHNFFLKYDGCNFIDVVPKNEMKRNWYERASLYQFFIPSVLSSSERNKTFSHLNGICNSFQRLIGINRFRRYEKQGYEMYYGSSWFSITDEFAKFVVSEEKKIKEMYEKFTFIPEESIMQTILMASTFRQTLFEEEWIDHKLNRQNLRGIIWTGKTSPETITLELVDRVMNSHNLFARKFDINNCPEAVNKTVEMVLESGKEV